MSDFYLAEALLRAQRPTFELGLDISREEEEEFRLEQERRRGIETRERKRGVATGRGRFAGGIPGGILGFMLGGPVGAAVGAGLGSFAGQKGAVAISPGAMKKFERIGPGRYYVARGREREEEFEFGETERGRIMQEQILTSSVLDAISGGLQAKYGGGILDMLLGKGGGVTFPGGAPEALTRRLGGLGPAPGSVEQSLATFLGGR